MSDAKKVCILKSSEEGLSAVEGFLRNRDWQILSSTSMKQALAMALTQQPDYLLIPADHPNSKVLRIPKLLKQALTIPIIGYCESQLVGHLRALNEMGCKYNLFPPVSGPSFERLILKIKRDEERANEQKQTRRPRLIRSEVEEEQQGPTILRQSGPQAEDEIIIHQRDETNSQRIGGIIHSEGDAQHSSEEGDIYDARNSHHTRGTDSLLNYSSSASEDAGGENFLPQTERLKKTEITLDLGSLLAQLESEKDDDPKDSMHPNELNIVGHKNFKTEEFNDNELQKSSKKRRPQGRFGEDQPKAFQSPDAALSDVEKDLSHQTIRIKTSWTPQNEAISLLALGTKEALETSKKIVQKDQLDDNPEPEAIEQAHSSNQCICLIVESPKFSGYLVAALGQGRQIDDEFMQLIQEKLFEFLKSKGESVTQKQSLDVKLESVPFESWALEQAEFLKKSIHKGHEIALAFFPTDSTAPTLEASRAEDMLQLDIDELKNDTIVEFDVYLHLPTNDRYVLYVPQGRTLFGDQRNRLAGKGVKKMHLKKDSKQDVIRYRAQNFLNEKINQFKSRAKG